MSEVVKQPAFVQNPEMVDACLDDAAETSTLPFLELLNETGGDSELRERQLAALRVLEHLDPSMVESLQTKLARHQSNAIRQRIKGLVTEESRDVIIAERGGYELVKIPGGVFMMGSPETEKGRDDIEGPVHEVRASSFYIGRYPVTNKEYMLYLHDET